MKMRQRLFYIFWEPNCENYPFVVPYPFINASDSHALRQGEPPRGKILRTVEDQLRRVPMYLDFSSFPFLRSGQTMVGISQKLPWANADHSPCAWTTCCLGK